MRTRSRPPVLLGIWLLLVSAAVPAPAVGAGVASGGPHGPAAELTGGATDRSDPRSEASPIRTTYWIEFDGDDVRIVARVDVPPRVSAVTATPPDGAAVVDATGFDEDDGTWRWTRGRDDPTPTITYRPAIPSHRTTENSYSVRGDDWAFVNDNDVKLSLRAWGTDVTWSTTMTTDDGYADSEMAFVGNVATLESGGDDGPAVTVATTPTRADGVDEDAVAAMLADAHRTVAPNAPPTHVSVFLVPSLRPATAGFSSFGASAIAVDGDTLWDGLVTHEYVHTRQRFERTSEMAWLAEAEAFYYMTLVSRHRGTISGDAFDGRVRADERVAETRLTSPPSGRVYSIAAEKGPHVLAALDREIRLATDGERSLQDVLAVTSHAEGRLTYEAFREAVVRVGGGALGPWVDRYVDGGELPETVPGWEDLPPPGWTPETAAVAVCVDGRWYDRGATVETEGVVTVASDGYGTLSANGSVRTAETPSVCRPRWTDDAPRGAVTTYRVESNASLFLSDRYDDGAAPVAAIELVDTVPDPTRTGRPRPAATPAPTVVATEPTDASADRRTVEPDPRSGVTPAASDRENWVVVLAGRRLGLRAVGLGLGALSLLVALALERRR